MEWRYCSEDWKSISLHDNFISGMLFEDDVTIEFEDGFDVCAENPLNDTGRHKYTGQAAVLLKNGRFISAKYPSYTEKLPDGSENVVSEEKMSLDELRRLELEVFDFDFEENVVTIWCSVWNNSKSFCEFKLSCDKLLFCWNELLGDSWFQK